MSWEVRLDDNWVITTDSRQHILNKVGKIKNKDTGKWEENLVGKRFGRLDTVIKYYLNQKIRNADISTLEEIKELYKKINNKLDELREGLGV